MELSSDNRNPWDTLDESLDIVGFLDRPANTINSRELTVKETLGVRYAWTE